MKRVYCLITLCILFVMAGGVQANDAVKLSASADMRATLQLIMNKDARCTVVLRNGVSYTEAKLGSVSDLVVILKLQNNYKHYDVYVPLAEISAVEVEVGGD